VTQGEEPYLLLKQKFSLNCIFFCKPETSWSPWLFSLFCYCLKQHTRYRVCQSW